jgi:hypothetical protein
MMFRKENILQTRRAGFGACMLLALLSTGALQRSLAANQNQPSFTSAEQAVQALDKAVKTDDQASLSRLLGPLSSSDDMVQDKADRQLFVEKYSEMHRLVREQDGSTVLYIGAENWPFPVPLVSKNGNWRFDLDAGEQEIGFRRIGEDEMTAIDTCHAIEHAVEHSYGNTGDDAVNAYAQRLVGAGNTPEESFHGYYFRLLRTPNGAAVVAYPSEYRSTGVMTFAVTGDGPVYEKDLGANTASVAKSMKSWAPNAKWQVVQ